jgi:hypothetical protein
MTVRAKWLLPACLLILVFSAAHAREGDIDITMPDGKMVTGHYDVQWGHFVLTKKAEKPAFGDLEFWTFWNNFQPTWTFVGKIDVPSTRRFVCNFSAVGQTYNTEQSIILNLGFEAACRNLPGYRADVALYEEKKLVAVGSGGGRGWRSTASTIGAYKTVLKTFQVKLEQFRKGSGWVSLGSDLVFLHEEPGRR